jgi:hypothetical protein
MTIVFLLLQERPMSPTRTRWSMPNIKLGNITSEQYITKNHRQEHTNENDCKTSKTIRASPREGQPLYKDSMVVTAKLRARPHQNNNKAFDRKVAIQGVQVVMQLSATFNDNRVSCLSKRGLYPLQGLDGQCQATSRQHHVWAI